MSLISYSSYKNNILDFNSEEYLKNQIESDSFDLFLDFIQKYRDIESEDLKKPIFSQTTKFKKNPNNYKHYKNLKHIRDKEKDEHKNVWTFQNPVEENTKLIVLIKSFLNKISDDNYNQLSTEFIDELLKIRNNNIFKIISEEIYHKCIFEIKYRSLYVNLCSKIWNNRQIHYNLADIHIVDNNYYWNYINDNKKYGPFFNEINTKNDIYKKSNFKKYFLNYIQQLYINKDLSFDSLEDDEIFQKKKSILLLVELIGLMYTEKFINFDIPNIIIIDLLHINNIDNIKDIEYELLFNLLKIIKDNKTNYTSLIEQKNIFYEYINIVQLIINNSNIDTNNISKRSIFFMNEIITILKIFIENKGTNNTSNISHSASHNSLQNQSNIELEFDKNLFINNLNNINELNINNIVNTYKSISLKDKNEIFYIIIDKYISLKRHNEHYISLINNIKDSDNYYNALDKHVNNIEDTLLDVPNANLKLIQLIEYINYDKNINNKYINILKNISSDDDSEDNKSISSDDSE